MVDRTTVRGPDPVVSGAPRHGAPEAPHDGAAEAAARPGGGGSWRVGSVEVLAVLLVLVVLFRGRITGALSAAWLQTWTTVFVSVLTQMTSKLLLF